MSLQRIGMSLLSPVLTLAGALKKPKMPAAAPNAARDPGRETSRIDDELRRRRGAAANELTGGGAEASTTGGKALLGM